MNTVLALISILQKHKYILFLLIILIPLILVFGQHKVPRAMVWLNYILLICYVSIILYYTVSSREPGHRLLNLQPFWSYALWKDYQYRWQIIMNIFLFIPFGFLVPFSTERGLIFTAFAGLLLSVTIEAIQYFYCLGYCELDDVFNNTLGTTIGFTYWKLLTWGDSKYGNKIRKNICNRYREIRDSILMLKK